MTNYTYQFTDENNEWMERLGDDGSVIQFGALETNPVYAEFLASSAEAAAFDATPGKPDASLTPAEKLANAGLTVEELQTLLGL